MHINEPLTTIVVLFVTGLIMVNYKFFCHMRASYFSFNT